MGEHWISPDPSYHDPRSGSHRTRTEPDVTESVCDLPEEDSANECLLLSFDATVRPGSLQTESMLWDLGMFLRCTTPREKFSSGGPEEMIQLLNLGWDFDLAGNLQMLILQMGGQRPQTQIMAKLIKTGFLLLVNTGYLLLKEVFKRSTLDMSKARTFII